ncbi:hypothetical protein TgHK011_003758 [Trichoderma gracile]|nr:hypothetical protein TgHK011_003758 [Trichoderma gracile]
MHTTAPIRYADKVGGRPDDWPVDADACECGEEQRRCYQVYYSDAAHKGASTITSHCIWPPFRRSMTALTIGRTEEDTDCCLIPLMLYNTYWTEHHLSYETLDDHRASGSFDAKVAQKLVVETNCPVGGTDEPVRGPLGSSAAIVATGEEGGMELGRAAAAAAAAALLAGQFS